MRRGGGEALCDADLIERVGGITCCCGTPCRRMSIQLMILGGAGCRAAPERSSPGRGVGQGVQRVEISIQIAIMKIIMMAPLGGHRSFTAKNVTAQSPRTAAAGSCRTCRRRLRSKRSPERGLFLADSCMIQFFLYCETHMHPLFRCTL